MFERYSESARRALFFSRYAVTQLGGATIEPEHLVLGVLHGAPQSILRFVRPGETVDTLRAPLEEASATGGETLETRVEVPFSPETKDVLQRTALAADELQSQVIRPEHIIVAVMVATFGAAMRVLRDAGVDAEAIREYLRTAPRDAADWPGPSHSRAGQVARHWRGVVKPGRAGDYVDHLRRETFAALARHAGFVSASILRREVEDGTEFQVVTIWESLEAIKVFAGEDVTTAVVPPAAQALLVRYDERAEHFEIVQ
jgi:ATP-dependent Clp protease ATP-binding subunit ClpA